MIRQSAPPILLRDVFDDVGEVVRLLERNAPYTPLGGWYRPDAELDTPTSPLWFQNDWVHADLRVEGSEIFLFHERVTQVARDFYGAAFDFFGGYTEILMASAFLPAAAAVAALLIRRPAVPSDTGL